MKWFIGCSGYGAGMAVEARSTAREGKRGDSIAVESVRSATAVIRIVAKKQRKTL